MSLGYAEKLSFREDVGGQLGAKEHFDDPSLVERDVETLVQLVRAANSTVVFTGAGISTAAGIPDFRGPDGVWTNQKAKKPLPKARTSFSLAAPSLTHQAIVTLVEKGLVSLVVSQNVDGLHLRSGLPRSKVAELHGNCFAERCIACLSEYVRDFEVESVGFKPTGRTCTKPGCRGKLVDHVLDWEDALPVDELRLTEMATAEADLAICLGTSLQITPACNLPLRATRVYKSGAKTKAGKLVIVNLQATPKDKNALKSGGLVIHARVDEVVQRLMQRLEIPIAPYVRTDVVIVGHELVEQGRKRAFNMAQSADGSDDNGACQGSSPQDAMSLAAKSLRLYVRNQHGAACPMPFLQSVRFSFADIKEFEAHAKVLPFQATFILSSTPTVKHVQVQVELEFNPDLNGPARKTFQYTARLGRRKVFEERVECETQHLTY